MSNRVDIGHGVSINCFEQDCVIHGFEIWHSSATDGTACVEHVPLAYKPEGFDGLTMVSKVPLTIAETIECATCGLSGRIVEGRWALA